MFALATRNFVEEVEDNGSLIPVTSLNNTIALLTVVVKRRRFWCWQKSKYLPTGFNLNDILTGDTPIKPGKPQKQHENGRMCHSLLSQDHRNLIFFLKYIYLPFAVVVETDFIKYSGTFSDNIQGTVDANFSKYSVKLQGEDSSKLQSSFGSLKKEEIDMQKLLQDSKDKLVHNLYLVSHVKLFKTP